MEAAIKRLVSLYKKKGGEGLLDLLDALHEDFDSIVGDIDEYGANYDPPDAEVRVFGSFVNGLLEKVFREAQKLP